MPRALVFLGAVSALAAAALAAPWMGPAAAVSSPPGVDSPYTTVRYAYVADGESLDLSLALSVVRGAGQDSPRRDAAPADAAVAAIDVMRRVLGELPEDTRQMLWLIEVEGYSRDEVAALYGSAPNTISVRLSRARQVLRNAFIGQSIGPGHGDACPSFTVDLAAQATGTLRPRASRRLDAHLSDCAECRARGDQASLTADRFAGAIIPALAWLLADGELALDPAPRGGQLFSPLPEPTDMATPAPAPTVAPAPTGARLVLTGASVLGLGLGLAVAGLLGTGLSW